MKRGIISIVLAVAMCSSSLGSISYAQAIEEPQILEETEEVQEAEETQELQEEQEVQEEANQVDEVDHAEPIVEEAWELSGIKFDKKSPQQLSEKITISADVKNPKEDLQYKFVWMRDNWKEWGVLQNFSEKNSVEWKPKSSGEYYFYVDVKDAAGRKATVSKNFKIVKNQWTYKGINPNESMIELGKPITISPALSGNTNGLQYKFVWMRDNWKEWKVLKAFSEEKEVTFTPDKTGKCTIYVDIKDQEGNVKSKSITYDVKRGIWKFESVKTNPEGGQSKLQNVEITAVTSGSTEGLQYKFVWMRDNWKEWGVIQPLSEKSTVTWKTPNKSGKYKLYVDVKDPDGVKKTIEKEYEVLPAPWKLEKLDIAGSPDRFVGDKVTVTAVTSGKTEGLQYKFVCRRGDDWSDWEVVQPFSEKNSVTIPLDKAADYHIYVDIREQGGSTMETKTVDVYSHKYTSAGASSTTINKGQSVKLYPNITGRKGEFQYKYVWMKNNWQEWGVIKELSSASSVTWTPKETGNYTIYIDVKANGITKSKSVKVGVNGYQNPSQYLQIKHVQKTLSGGGYELSKGFMGLKVLYTQRKLGLNRTRAIMDDTTMLAVRKFQSSRKLPVTGVVNYATWKAMGFTEEQWYGLGTYASKLKTNPNSTRKDCIEAMISTAYEYLGTEYVIGAAGAPGTGIDCSGLVMQALYAAGIDPEPVNPVRHSHPGYEYESRNMWNLPMKKVPYNERQRGDLIFYTGPSGYINHVAIYLGNDQVIESWPTKVVVWPIKNSHRSAIKGVMRPFV